jgi:hypothetical protein
MEPIERGSITSYESIYDILLKEPASIEERGWLTVTGV